MQGAFAHQAPNRRRVIADFLRVPFARPHDLASHARKHLHPVPAQSLYAREDDRWLIEHGRPDIAAITLAVQPA